MNICCSESNPKRLACNKRHRYIAATILIITMLLASNFAGLDEGSRFLESSVDNKNDPASKSTSREAAAMNEKEPDEKENLVIDFLSIGSLTKKEWQATQMETFGAHPSVRNFFLIDERNDTDATCHTNFTDMQLREVLKFCNNTEGEDQSFELKLMRKKLFWPKRHTWWLCAQKRPIDGIYFAVQHYQSVGKTLPDYLMIIDDDTFINMNGLTELFRQHYPVHENHVVAGCRFTYPRKIAFAFPYGGFSSILTRASLRRLIQPVYCKESLSGVDQTFDEEFNRMACWRLGQNLIGEADFFTDGMSVGELMYHFSAGLPFTGIGNWNKTGFCMHSDHSLGYFFNFYHLGAPHGILDRRPLDDKIRMEYSYEFLAGDNQCGFEKHNCVKDALICHYIRPERMVSLQAEQELSS